MFHFFGSRGEAAPAYSQELTWENREAKVTADILPGESGQVLVSGVYWRARTNGNTPIQVGRKVSIVCREATTLLVSSV